VAARKGIWDTRTPLLLSEDMNIPWVWTYEMPASKTRMEMCGSC
jgi:hypothetical protein